MSHRLRNVVVALCLIAALTGCEGLPPGAGDTVKRLAALDIVTTPPPQGVLVAYQEDLGHAGQGFFLDPSVTVAYATPASIDEVRDFFISTFPAYDLAEGSGGDARQIFLVGEDADTHIQVSISVDAPHYAGHSTPSPSPAPDGADVYVVVDASPRTGVAAPAGSARIGVVHGDSLVDTDGDGILDAVRMPVAVEVEEPGLYTLVVDIIDANGVKASTHGAASLEAGAGAVNIDLPLDTMIDLGMNGPLTLVNGLLVRGDHGDFLATASDMGTTAAYDPFAVPRNQPAAEATESAVVDPPQFTAIATDTDGDGVVDTATFSGSIFAPEAGRYMISTHFETPGVGFTITQGFADFDAGMNAYSLEFPLDLASDGTGTYVLSGTVVGSDDASLVGVFGSDVFLEVGDATP
jgi:hypothetical protein